ncbi:MAG: hypothetical protein K2N44_12400 [Lachnospiraceae bacterium]|nr:hypothetical protein [Lachnospiraceae bacterium]
MYAQDKKRILQYFKDTAFPECKNGNRSYLGALQRIFVFSDEKQMQTEAAAIDEEVLSNISVKDLLWLSENFRSWRWDFYVSDMADWDIDFSRDNFLHLSDGQYEALLKFGTFISNGYSRQWCVELLGHVEGALPFLILRMNDWVALVRERAFDVARQRVNECRLQELFFALPMLEKVTYSGRRDADRLHDLQEQMEHVIGQKLRLAADEELDAICHYEISVKNAVYRFVNQNKVLERGQMERLLSAEKASYGKRLLILGILQHHVWDSEKAEEYLASKSAIVRYYVLLYRYEREKSAWAGLEKMLLDSSKRIRENAAYIFVKRKGMNVTSYYLQELKRHVSKTVLLGIGENGTKQEINAVLPFLENTDEQICKAALIAYGNLAEESGEAVYWRFLSDDNSVLARQAYRLIQKYQILYSALSLYNGFMQSRERASGECFLKLLLCAPPWQRLPYLLMLYCDAELSDAWHSVILSKICERNLYARISKQQEREICDILEQNAHQIPAMVSERIRFDLRYVVK